MSGDKLTVTEATVDGGFDGASVEAAETLWACLPQVRKWTSLATHEKALVIHTLARHRTNTTTELVEALRPFAKHAEHYEGWADDHTPTNRVVSGQGVLSEITLTEFRRARKALTLHDRGERK